MSYSPSINNNKFNIKLVDFEDYCINNNIKPNIINNAKSYYLKAGMILNSHEFKNLIPEYKNCVLIASILLITITNNQLNINDFFDYFHINPNDEEVIMKMIYYIDNQHDKINNIDNWQTIPRDAYVLCNASIEGIIGLSKKFKYNINIKDEIYSYCKMILNNQYKIINKITNNKYENNMNDIEKLCNILNTTNVYYRADIENFYD